MDRQPRPYDELSKLAAALCDGSIGDDDFARFERLLADDPAARQWYLAYMDLHGELCWNHLVGKKRNQDEQSAAETSGDLLSAPIHAGSPFIVPAISTSPDSASLSTIPAVLFSYGFAAVIVGLGLLAASAWKIADLPELAKNSSTAAKPHVNAHAAVPHIARITGTADCRWEKKGLGIRDWGLEEGSRFKVQGPRPKRTQSLTPNPLSPISLGDQFILSSGLMEITYNTGAKVILQGPCTYEVDSADGGFLTVGKLTARVEKSTKYGVRSTERLASDGMQIAKCKLQNANCPSPNPEIPKSLNPSLTTNHYPLFTIKTPTTAITDLGTEFGVEVDNAGTTISHVFRGSVQVESIAADGKTRSDARVLRENESVCVKRRNGAIPTVALRSLTPSQLHTFIRELPKPKIKTLDLADIVAGGDGFSNKRNAGIDPRSGQFTNTLSLQYYQSDGKYHPVEGTRLIDGVFIPRPQNDADPVQLDSAGHTCVGLPTNNFQTLGNVWAGKEEGNCSVLGGVDYSRPGRGMIALHANKGITFDLNAIRQANPGWKPRRFLGTAGIAVPAERNLIPNGSFSSGLNGWIGNAEPIAATIDESSPDGRAMLLAGPSQVYCQVPNTAVAERESFEFSFKAAVPEGVENGNRQGELLVRLLWVDGDRSGEIGEPVRVPIAELKNGWSGFSTTWTIPAGYDGKSPQIRFEAVGDGVRVAVDDVFFAHRQDGIADFRTFIDGRLRMQLRDFGVHSGALPVQIPIRDDDRFLTFVVTDANNGVFGDHAIFGDPRIELFQDEQAALAENDEMTSRTQNAHQPISTETESNHLSKESP